MIEIIVLNYLNDALGVPVYMEQPADAPIEYVLLQKTGSRLENHIKRATLAIQSYSDSMYKAAVLNEAVKEAMLNMVVLPEVSRCDLNSDYNFTDTAQKRYRYQAVFDLVHY